MSGTVVLFGSYLLLVFSLTAAHRECNFNDTELETGDERSPHENNPHFKWEGGKIPYEFTSTVGDWDKKLFKVDMKRIEAQSCFRFHPRTSRDRRAGKKYLEIEVARNAPSCAQGRFSAHVTNKYLVRGTKNALLLFSRYQLADQARCRDARNKDMYEGGILHEMFHAIGIGHTQRRPDRNNYIRVYPGNLQNPSQYDPCRDCKLYPQIPYECNSIMHYGYETFRKPGYGKTMESRSRGCTVTAWGNSLPTSNDWRLVKIIANQVCGSGNGGGSNPGRWSAWQNHGYCSVTCGTGTQKQTRTCIGGTGCAGDSERYFPCEQPKCEDEDCGNWFCCNWGIFC